MGLLAQYFRHIGASPDGDAGLHDGAAPGVGAIAAAAEMPAETGGVAAVEKSPEVAAPSPVPGPAPQPAPEPARAIPSHEPPSAAAPPSTLHTGNAPTVSASEPPPPVRILAPRAILPPPPGSPPAVILAPVAATAVTAGGGPAAADAPDFAGLQKLFMTGAAPDLAGVAALAAALPGVRACVISGSAGDAAAGSFFHGVSESEVRAILANRARIRGAATATLHRGESDIVIFLHENIRVAALTAAGDFVPGVRERLAQTAELLAGR